MELINNLKEYKNELNGRYNKSMKEIIIGAWLIFSGLITLPYYPQYTIAILSTLILLGIILLGFGLVEYHRWKINYLLFSNEKI
jgi:uncharacterized membrane protein